MNALVKVDDHINKLEEVKKKVSERRDALRKKAEDEKLIDDNCPTENMDVSDHPGRLVMNRNGNRIIFSLRDAVQKKNRIFHDIMQNSFDTYPPYLIMT